MAENDPQEIFAVRRRKLAQGLADHGCDFFLTTRVDHVRWLTGFDSSNAGVLLGADGSTKIATDSRYATQVRIQAPGIDVIDSRNTAVGLIGDLIDRSDDPEATLRIGIEASALSVATFRQLEKFIADATGEPDADSTPSVELVETNNVVEQIRLVKSEDELDRLRNVAQLAVDAYESLLADDMVRPGMTERQVAAELEYRMRLRGADGPSFDTIVASGPNSAKPHHSASDRVIEEGDLVTIDFGAWQDGYASDKTRTLIAGGKEKGSEFSREIYNVVLRAQLAGIEAATAGTKLFDVDKACRDVISEAGYGEYFVHSTGHGIGIEVHEMPAATAKAGDETLEPGMTLTVEPGIYVPEQGGVRIEDTVIITADGAPEVITKISKELL